MAKIKVLAVSILFFITRIIVEQLTSFFILAIIFIFRLSTHFESNNSFTVLIFSDVFFLYLLQNKIIPWLKIPHNSIKLWTPLINKDKIIFILLCINSIVFIGILAFIQHDDIANEINSAGYF